MRNWLDRYHGMCESELLAAPIEGLPILDRKGLQHYQAELLQEWNSKPAMTCTQLKEYLEQGLGATCSKNTGAFYAVAFSCYGERVNRYSSWRRLY